MSHSIFISYSEPDKATAESLVRGIEENGFKCWIAHRDIPPGKSWPEQIIKAIDNCDTFLLVHSRHSNESEHVMREVHHAFSGKKHIVPARMDEVELDGGLSYYLGTCHWLKAHGRSIEKVIPEICERLQQSPTQIAANKSVLEGGNRQGIFERINLKWIIFLTAAVLSFAALLSLKNLMPVKRSEPISIAGNFDGRLGNKKSREHDIGRINDVLKLKNCSPVRVEIDYSDKDLQAFQSSKDPYHQNVSKLLVALIRQFKDTSKPLPDIIEADFPWLTFFAHQGWITPIEPNENFFDIPYRIRYEGASLIPPNFFSSEALLYGMPNYLSVGLVMFRQDHLPREPESWEDFVEMYKTLKTQEKYKNWRGIAIQGANYEGFMCNFLEFLWANGGRIQEREGVPVINSEKVIETVEWMKEMVEIGFIAPESFSDTTLDEGMVGLNEKSSESFFAQGKSFALRNWPTTYYRFLEADFPEVNDVQIVKHPLHLSGGNPHTAKSCLGGALYCISTEAVEKGREDMARSIIQFFVEDSFLRNNMVENIQLEDGGFRKSVRIPPSATLMEDLKRDFPALSNVHSYFTNGYFRSRPKIKTYPAFSAIVTRHIHRYLNPDIDEFTSAKEALDVAQEKINKLHTGDPVQNTIEFLLW